MEEYWLVNLFDIIYELSDIQLQQDSWTGKSSRVSSFEELIASLYDDNQFESFINHDFWSDCSSKLKELNCELRELNSLLDSYNVPLGEIDEIFSDPAWLEIVSKATRIKKLWIINITNRVAKS